MQHNPDPSAPERNLHHTATYRSEEDFLEDLLGRGPGDPDFHGYPGETITKGDTDGIQAIPDKPIDWNTDVPF